MNLNQIYPKLKIDRDILGITCDSKKVKENYIFVVIKGKKQNGKNFIKEALDLGACLIVTDQIIFGDFNHIKVKDAKKEYIKLLQQFYHYSPNIYTIGITGTDGKTTTSTLLNNILNLALSSAYIGTNGINYLNRKIKFVHTTPTPDLLYKTYNSLKKYKINNLVLEVSSEGILDGRVNDFKFNGAIFTNLSHEHLNTHKTMQNYIKAKAVLFSSLDKNGLAVINADDYYSHYLKYYTKAKIISYGINDGMYKANNINMNFNKTEFDVFYKGHLLAHFSTALFGRYNVYNALAAIAYANELGIDIKYIKAGIETITEIDGRFMLFTSKNKITGIVDFAHTPNALLNLLSNINEIKKGKSIIILGAQGEKDYTKREKMGVIATTYSDITIFTSEDPKNESLFGILYDLTKNIENKEYYITLSRKDAINLASQLAKPNDIILVTGKGNETYEQVQNYRFNNNDLLNLKNALNLANK